MSTVLSFSVFVSAEVLKWANILPHKKKRIYFLSLIVSHNHIQPVPSRCMYLAGLSVPILLQWPFSFPRIIFQIQTKKKLKLTSSLLRIGLHAMLDDLVVNNTNSSITFFLKWSFPQCTEQIIDGKSVFKMHQLCPIVHKWNKRLPISY